MGRIGEALAMKFKTLEGVDHFDGLPTEPALALRPKQPVPAVGSLERAS